jgi:hypothetical protein
MKKIYKLAVILFLFIFSNVMKAQTTGTLTFTFTCPKHTSGNYESDGRYALAVWIESCAPCGTTEGTSTFVKTKLRCWGTKTADHLPTWVSKSGSSTIDATTGATMGKGGTGTFNSIANAFLPQTVTWNGTNTSGTVVADGSYRVVIQETWGHFAATATRYFPFTKGPSIDSQTPTTDTNFTAISLVWSPTLGVVDITKTPDFIVYPNPSKGIFTIDFKNETKNIKVVNLLGEVVYNEDIDSSLTETTKKIDLSSFATGVYVFNLTNDQGTSTYKVLLDK